MSATMVIICQVLLAYSVLLRLKDVLFARYQQSVKTAFKVITLIQQLNFALDVLRWKDVSFAEITQVANFAMKVTI